MKAKAKASVKISAFVTPAQKKALDAISANTGAPLVFLVRKAIEDYLARTKR